MDSDDSNSSEEEKWIAHWQRIKQNDPDTTELDLHGNTYIQNFTDEDWEVIGLDINNNTQLKYVCLYDDALNDHEMSFFFRGLTSSLSIEHMGLGGNQLSAEGMRSMVPFLQNANNLVRLNFDHNDLQSEGFNMLLRALHNSPIIDVRCCDCGIESIEIDNEQKPMQLQELNLDYNEINADGCRGLAKLLQGQDSALTRLYLCHNKIDDEGVAIFVDALQNNTSLKVLNLFGNDDISQQGRIMFLKLLIDISSIKATMQSNHTLRYARVDSLVSDIYLKAHISMALEINREEDNPEVAARTKVIKSQLDSGVRAELAELQGVRQSLYSEINPLHLPEVLALVGRHHDQGELYVALKSSIAGLISTVNKKQCVQQQIADYRAKIAEYQAKMEAAEVELAAIEAAEGHAVDMGNESCSNKRPRM